MRRTRAWRGCAALLAAALAGCAGAGNAAAEPETSAGLGKPTAAFSLTAEAIGPPRVGVPVTLRITVRPHAALEDIEVQIAADAGLSLDPAGQAVQAASADPSHAAEWQITAVPVEAGTHRLRLFGTAQQGGERHARSVVATIRVEPGTPAARDSAARSASPERRAEEADADAADGQRVIRLPAIERP